MLWINPDCFISEANCLVDKKNWFSGLEKQELNEERSPCTSALPPSPLSRRRIVSNRWILSGSRHQRFKERERAPTIVHFSYWYFLALFFSPLCSSFLHAPEASVSRVKSFSALITARNFPAVMTAGVLLRFLFVVFLMKRLQDTVAHLFIC